MIDGLIYETNTGECIALIKNGDELCSVAGRRKFATVKNGELYSLTGAPLGLTLADLNDDPERGGKIQSPGRARISASGGLMSVTPFFEFALVTVGIGTSTGA
jgi:hypothetical protein